MLTPTCRPVFSTDADLLPADAGAPRAGGTVGLADDLLQAPTAQARHDRLAAAMHALGIDWLACGQLTRQGTALAARRWHLPHAHVDWLRHAVDERHHEIDPRLTDATASCVPVVWDLGRLARRVAAERLGLRGERLVAGLRARGIRSGVWLSLPAAGRPDDHAVICLDARTEGSDWVTDGVLGQALLLALSVHEFLSTRLPPQCDAPAPVSLSSTQQGVLDCLREGHSDKVIADRMHLSLHTVDYHMRQLRRRFAARNRVQLAHAALGLACPDRVHIL